MPALLQKPPRHLVLTDPTLPDRVPESETRRRLIARVSGRRQGPVTRVFGPREAGALLKPFVFLDYFDFMSMGSPMFPMHPHSGIATTTVLLSGRMRYEDTTGAAGVLEAGSVEWMRAGRGVWHDGVPIGSARFRGYQIWVALPQDLETAEARSQYMGPEAVPRLGPARVILGRHGDARSEVEAPTGVQLLHVQLRHGERWQLRPPQGHSVGWFHVSQGALHFDGHRLENELAVLDDSGATVDLVAEGETEFLLGTAIKHPHDLVLGHYSVHTSHAALRRGEQEIAQLGEQLRARGRVR